MLRRAITMTRSSAAAPIMISSSKGLLRSAPHVGCCITTSRRLAHTQHQQGLTTPTTATGDAANPVAQHHHAHPITITRAPTSVEDMSIHLPPHRYAFHSDDYRMPHLTYETSKLEDDAGVILVERKNIIVSPDLPTPDADGHSAASSNSNIHSTAASATPSSSATPTAEDDGFTFCNLYNKHRVPADWCDWAARSLVTFARASYDLFTGYAKYNHDLRGVSQPDQKAGGINGIGFKHNADGSTSPLCSSNLWLSRAIFLETVAAVPGMVAGMLRHLRSLRILKKDDGWIHALLEEAENERMHLFFFLKEKQPGLFFRMTIAGAQGAFFIFNAIGYLISPRFMHRFVGYIEEEAVHTYSIILRDIDRGLVKGDDKSTPSPLPADHISHWRTKPAPIDYIKYYDLHKGATYRDVILCIRADELSHREHNHMYADAHALNAQAQVSKILHDSQPLTVIPKATTVALGSAATAAGALAANDEAASAASQIKNKMMTNNENKKKDDKILNNDEDNNDNNNCDGKAGN